MLCGYIWVYVVMRRCKWGECVGVGVGDMRRCWVVNTEWLYMGWVGEMVDDCVGWVGYSGLEEMGINV